MSPRHLRHRHAGRSGLPADRALLLGAPVAIPAPTRHRSRQQSVHYLQWAPSPTSAFMIDVEARSARAGSPDAHTDQAFVQRLLADAPVLAATAAVAVRLTNLLRGQGGGALAVAPAAVAAPPLRCS